MLTAQDRSSLLAVLAEGWASFVGLHRMDSSGHKEFWEDHPQFGALDRDEKYWPLGPEDHGEKSPLFRAIATAAEEARDQGYWKLIVRFYGAKNKEQADRIIILSDRKSSRGGAEALDVQSSRIQLETTAQLSRALASALPTLKEAFSGSNEDLRQTNRQLLDELRAGRTERNELAVENRELRKRVRELEEDAGPMVLALKAMDPANMAGQATIMAGLRGIFGALQAGSFKEALVKFGKEGMDGLDELTKSIPDAPQPQIQDSPPPEAPQ